MEGMNPQYLVISRGKVTTKYQICSFFSHLSHWALFGQYHSQPGRNELKGYRRWAMAYGMSCCHIGAWLKSCDSHWGGDVQRLHRIGAWVASHGHQKRLQLGAAATDMALTRHTWRFELSLIIHCHFFLFYYSLYNAFLSMLSFVVVIYVSLPNPSPMHGECVLFLCANMNVIGTPPQPHPRPECTDCQFWVTLSVQMSQTWSEKWVHRWWVPDRYGNWAKPCSGSGVFIMFYFVLLKPLPLLLTSWQDLLRNICFTDHVHLDNQCQQHKSTQTPTPKLTNDIARILCAY